MVHIEFPELPGAETAEYIRVAQLSLLDDKEKSAINEVRLKYENEGNHKHGHKHPHGFWHRHARDHNHDCELKPEHGHKHRLKHGQECGPEDLPSGYKPSKQGPGDGSGKDLPPPYYIEDPNAPKDKGYFVLIIIGLYGLVHMMPIMFFLTANEYWMYKFRNTTSNSNDANDRTYLQTNFASLNKLTITAPGVICNFIAAIGGHKIRAQVRVFSVLAIHSAIFICSAIFTQIDTDDWQTLFFVISMLLQLIMSCAMSLGGSGSMGLISKLPPRYMKSLLMGEGLAALFSAILRLISIFCTPSTVGAAMMYFVTGSVTMVVTSVVFYFSTQTKFFKYYTRSCKDDQKESIRTFAEFKEVFKIIWPLIILNVFPLMLPVASVTNLVVSEYYGTDNIWGTKYFITVCTYVIPAAAGIIGRAIFSYMDYDCSISTLYFLGISREAIFAVLIVLANAKPRHHLPVLLTHDWQYALAMAASALSSGFMMTLTMLKTMRSVPKNRIELSMMCNLVFMSILMAATSPLGVLVDCSIPTLSVLVISRETIFGALIFLSNAKPRHHLSVLLKHDWEFTLMMVGNSLTAGFIMTLNMIKSMRMVPKERIELSMMCNMFIMSIISAAT